MLRCTRFVALLVAGSLLAVSTMSAVTAPAASAAGLSATAWADGFCMATTEWLNGALSGVTEMGQVIANPATTPKQARAALVDFLATGVKATRNFGKVVESAGPPDVDGGPKISSTIVKGISGARAELAGLLASAKKLTTASRRALEKAGRPIVGKLGDFAVPFQNALNTAQNLDTSGALDTAFSSVDSCIQLSS